MPVFQPYGNQANHFDSEAPASYFSGEAWAAKARAYTSGIDKLPAGMIPEALTQSRALLHSVVATMRQFKPNIRILDFGGAAGADFAFLTLASMEPRLNISYHVVDFEAVTSEGAETFKRDGRIRFSTDLPDACGFDVVYSSSAIQYAKDQAATLNKLCSYGANAVLLCRTPVSETSFVRRQVNLGTPVAQRVIGFSELLSIMSRNSYVLQSRSWSEENYNVENFSADQASARTANLLFTRSA